MLCSLYPQAACPQNEKYGRGSIILNEMPTIFHLFYGLCERNISKTAGPKGPRLVCRPVQLPGLSRVTVCFQSSNYLISVK